MADKPPSLRDSYAEFSGGIWRHIIRSKREYREVKPPEELQNGQPVQSVNETVDPSVAELIAENNKKSRTIYNPPNLWARREALGLNLPDEPRHRYLDGGVSSAILVFWLSMITVAAWRLATFLPGNPPEWMVVAFIAAIPLLALIADWRESVLNHSVSLRPYSARAERHKAWMDVCLAIRLGAIGLFFAGVGISLSGLVSHFTLSAPSTAVLSLGGLSFLALWFSGTKAWCSAPMTEAGMGSIVELQSQRTAQGVTRCLLAWSGLTPAEATPENRQLLMPVVRTLWRDILGFIPAYSLFLFVGSWLAISLGAALWTRNLPEARWLLSLEWYCWLPALVLTTLAAMGDYIEDAIHLQHVEEFPKVPSRRAVIVASIATWIKLVFFSIGLVLVGLSAVGLIGLVALELYRQGKAAGTANLLAVISLGFSIPVLAGVARDMMKKQKPCRPTPTIGR